MLSISLSTQTIRIIGPDGKSLPVSKFKPGFDLLDVLYDYFNDLIKTGFDDEKEKFLLSLVELEKKERTISGLMELGEYGRKSKLLDRTKWIPSYYRLETDAEMLPYYFLIFVPRNSYEAIAIFQKSGGVGVQEKFDYSFGSDFFTKYQFHIQINKLVPSFLINQYLDKGKVTKIKFVRFGIPSDIADVVGLGCREDEGIAELHITAKGGRSLDVLKDRIRDSMRRSEQAKDIESFVELKDFKYDDVKVQIGIGGKYRTFSILNPENIRADYDISNEFGPEKAPLDYFNIDRVARKLMRDVARSIGLDIRDV